VTKLVNTKLVDHGSPDESIEVIGIIKDYNQTSLKYQVRPLAFRYNVYRGHFSIRFDEAHLKQGEFDDAITSLNELWKQTYPESSFDYYFLNEKFRAQDQQDQYFGSLFQAFTILSMILSCLGLFGLSILISAKRQKEIGVRKTFGASSLDILNLFMRGYLGPLATALIIGSAGSYFLMREWLTNFANRIEIGPSLMLSAVATLIAIFIGTISYHTVKAALTNPVSVLRD
jgi:putative ABC transport system permease protein